ncbi:hypothetical protein R0381_003236 [Jeongeupia wiesaeckerbachi]
MHNAQPTKQTAAMTLTLLKFNAPLIACVLLLLLHASGLLG